MDVSQWYTYGYEWTPDRINFYCDNILRYSVDSSTYPNPYGPSNLWLTLLAYKPCGDTNKLPAESTFDYIRYYSKNYGTTNLLGNGNFDFNRTRSTPAADPQLPTAWIESGSKDASFVTSNSSEIYSGTNALKQYKSMPYIVTTKQHLQFIPNGTYKLTAMVKSSGGQAEATMRALKQNNVELARVNIPATSTWQQITIDNINVTDNGAWIAFTSNDTVGGKYLLIDDVVFQSKTAIPLTLNNECESLTNKASDSITNYSEFSTSAGAFSHLNSNAVNDYIEYTINVTQPGTYSVFVNNKVAYNKGIYQLKVDGTNLGTIVDNYVRYTAYNETSMGDITISSAGIHLFWFTVIGKNASSSGYNLGFDYIKLVKN